MIDWKSLGEETVDVLRRYLMVDTTNPPGNEIDGARFLAIDNIVAGVRSYTEMLLAAAGA